MCVCSIQIMFILGVKFNVKFKFFTVNKNLSVVVDFSQREYMAFDALTS